MHYPISTSSFSLARTTPRNRIAASHGCDIGFAS
jgi:hypothetical protein